MISVLKRTLLDVDECSCVVRNRFSSDVSAVIKDDDAFSDIIVADFCFLASDFVVARRSFAFLPCKFKGEEIVLL